MASNANDLRLCRNHARIAHDMLSDLDRLQGREAEKAAQFAYSHLVAAANKLRAAMEFEGIEVPNALWKEAGQ